MQYHSQIGQDKLVLTYLKNKKNGFFLDIGCCYPIQINNTFVLEKDYDWKGISIDIYDFQESTGETWRSCRNTTHVIDDALKIDYKKLLTDYDAPKVIDYLSMDLEPPDLTLECLNKIPFDEYTFNFISFEVDYGRDNYENRINVSRKIFQDNGYIYLGSICGGQDDIYIHNSLGHLKDELNLKEVAGVWG